MNRYLLKNEHLFPNRSFWKPTFFRCAHRLVVKVWKYRTHTHKQSQVWYNQQHIHYHRCHQRSHPHHQFYSSISFFHLHVPPQSYSRGQMFIIDFIFQKHLLYLHHLYLLSTGISTLLFFLIKKDSPLFDYTYTLPLCHLHLYFWDKIIHFATSFLRYVCIFCFIFNTWSYKWLFHFSWHKVFLIYYKYESRNISIDNTKASTCECASFLSVLCKSRFCWLADNVRSNFFNLPDYSYDYNFNFHLDESEYIICAHKVKVSQQKQSR